MSLFLAIFYNKLSFKDIIKKIEIYGRVINVKAVLYRKK